MDNPNAEPTTEILGVHDCWGYLRSTSVGRLAVVIDTGPEIFPVNYLPEDGTLIFRTGPGTKLEALIAGGMVAFEADGLNSYGTIAWSVVLKGKPETVESAGLALDRDLSPWEEGVKDTLVRITPTEVTGRRFVVTSAPTHWWQPRDHASAGGPLDS
ncbi:hypothetical protein SRABI83_00227 [Arthrobacter sp. Bi83]|jgi:nitroimidazol reductase NimA-like FMN-containing flavoprotein (pyridoxamine 5'-phosphate oxidase superfamily)|uniref:pyridoxamine 5'-phosphate oxidase family protein n=1 Tax=Arthrobacter sp. Bi83 TaxID=2822353 RepID=UPI001E0003E8|nr:pyridoxamine 5'-phosphate oxidase family protein [Arthrobacter sp. Bi83]CAH0130433.1 hypothetical protein SRABI83_00227 [Arthrobacter sp. Bi83]